MKYYVHESSFVDDGASIGFGTKIWHFCHISGGCEIGDKTSIGQNVYIANDVIVGNGCKIQNNVSIYDSVILEDNVFCGPNMVFTNVENPRASINRKDEYKKTLIKRGASLGANCTIVCGNTIGTYAFIGAGAVVTKDVKNFALVTGVPARQLGWVNKQGNRIPLPLSGSAKYECVESDEVYILDGDSLYLSND